MPFAQVALPIPKHQTFTYTFKPQEHPHLDLGSRVLVPFGRRQLVGFVVSLPLESDQDLAKLREIIAVLDEVPVFSPALLSLLQEMAEETLTPLGEVLQVALPAALHKAKTKVLDLSVVDLSVSDLSSKVSEDRSPPQLTPDQRTALTTIQSLLSQKKTATFLLHGVTGSGKTEIYLSAIEEALKEGASALLLTPEIGLTPQLGKRVKKRFGNLLGLSHSKLSQKERFKTWDEVRRGNCRLVVGTRSSIFLPFQNLRLIIIDEEQDHSYKQDDHFRYLTRHIANKRVAAEGALLILGSATPSLESYAMTQEGLDGHHYQFLGERATGASLPSIEICDMREERSALFSRPLLAAIEHNLNEKKQTLLYLNRRGFATFIVCEDCGHYFFCPNCHIAMTLHSRQRELHCHYCDHREGVPALCPKCQGGRVSELGFGTERVEMELQALYPAARLLRLDRDTMTKKDSWPEALRKIDQGEVDIVVGTQMVAKGHDYHGITLVGILNADTALNFLDFRAAERTFQMVLQVAGRAGRGRDPGRVFVQTYHPEHPCFQDLQGHQIQKFYETELALRRDLGYPPWRQLVRIELSGLHENKVVGAIRFVADRLRNKLASESVVLGPAPCPIHRLRNRFRHHLLIKTDTSVATRNCLKALLLDPQNPCIPAGVRLIIDFSPLNLL